MNELLKEMRDVLLKNNAEIWINNKGFSIEKYLKGGDVEHFAIHEKYIDAAILDSHTKCPALPELFGKRNKVVQ